MLDRTEAPPTGPYQAANNNRQIEETSTYPSARTVRLWTIRSKGLPRTTNQQRGREKPIPRRFLERASACATAAINQPKRRSPSPSSEREKPTVTARNHNVRVWKTTPTKPKKRTQPCGRHPKLKRKKNTTKKCRDGTNTTANQGQRAASFRKKTRPWTSRSGAQPLVAATWPRCRCQTAGLSV